MTIADATKKKILAAIAATGQTIQVTQSTQPPLDFQHPFIVC